VGSVIGEVKKDRNQRGCLIPWKGGWRPKGLRSKVKSKNRTSLYGKHKRLFELERWVSWWDSFHVAIPKCFQFLVPIKISIS